jgi:hypothetical protein
LCIFTQMKAYERARIDLELKAFTRRNFEKPSECRNLDQIKFYSTELCLKIEEYENRFSFAPAWAYTLLEQYTLRQNSLSEYAPKTLYS